MGQTKPEEDPVHRGDVLVLEHFFKVNLPKPTSVDVLANLRPDSPELLHRTAIRLQNSANSARRFLSNENVLSHLVAKTRQSRLLKMACVTILDPKLTESRVFLPQWVKWWNSKNNPIPYDTRLDVDRFVAYVIEQIHDDLSKAADQFEQDFDERYRVFLTKQEVLRASSALGDTAREPCLTSAFDDLAPTNV